MARLPRVITIDFENGRSAKAIEVRVGIDPEIILDHLELTPYPRAVISISGGANDYPREIYLKTCQAMKSVVEVAYEERVMIIDGGTNAGIMKIVGDIFSQMNEGYSRPPLLGVVPNYMVTYPGALGRRHSLPASLDSNHQYFILLHGATDWGGEVESMFALVGRLSQEMPSIGIIANGGITTLHEVFNSIKQGREIIVLRGSKRAVKVILAAIEGESDSNLTKLLMDKDMKLLNPEGKDNDVKLQDILDGLKSVAGYGKITCFDLDSSPQKLKILLLDKLKIV